MPDVLVPDVPDVLVPDVPDVLAPDEPAGVPFRWSIVQKVFSVHKRLD